MQLSISMRIVKYALNNALQDFLSLSVIFHPQIFFIYLANGRLYDPAVLPSGTLSPVPVVEETAGIGPESVFIFWRKETFLLPAQTLNCASLALRPTAWSVHQTTKLSTPKFYTCACLETIKLRDLTTLTALWILLPGVLVKNYVWPQRQNTLSKLWNHNQQMRVIIWNYEDRRSTVYKVLCYK